jgi:hypothetical protein
MGARKKRRRVGMVVATCVTITSLITFVPTVSQSEEQGPYLGVPQQREKIDRIIADLSQESLEESIAIHVKNDDLYFYPNLTHNITGAQKHIEWIFSNRRAVKILFELKQLGAVECDRRFGEMFEQYLAVHTATLRAVIAHLEDPSAPKNHPSMISTQLAVATAMLGTAAYGRNETLKGQFRALESLRRECEERIARNKLPRGGPELIRIYTMPDRRFRLNLLVLDASKRHDDAVLAKFRTMLAALTQHDLLVVPWDAHTTAFDIPHRMEFIPVDESKGSMTFRFYGWKIDDLHKFDFQDKTLREAEELVLSL